MMNKQEVIKELEYLKLLLEKGSKDNYNSGFINALTYALNVTNQLDEPEKPVVPQFVAEWYEDNKDNFEMNIFELCVEFRNCRLDNPKLRVWFQNTLNKGIQTLVNMHQFGYEVEKEKLYQVELPGSHKHGDIILVKDDDGDITYDVVFSDKWKERDYTKLTESEIKQDFAWAWKYAEEVEEC